ncbi:MAG: class I SAM-dependent methyltransferase [Solirubrobacterales bacterium]
MSRSDFYASPFGAAYSAYMEHPRLSRLVARIVWGANVRPYYESMTAVAGVPSGGTVVDCPCGAGPALRVLSPEQEAHFLAIDLSPSMLGRARRRAQSRGLTQVELIHADASKIPLPDASADLFLSYWGLHCFDERAAALAEASRILKPGARLVGSTFVTGSESLRQRLLVRPGAGDFGQVGSAEDIVDWLRQAGFTDHSIRRSGPMMFFEARLAR